MASWCVADSSRRPSILTADFHSCTRVLQVRMNVFEAEVPVELQPRPKHKAYPHVPLATDRMPGETVIQQGMAWAEVRVQ